MILQVNGVETLNLVVSFVVALYESKFSEPSETEFLRFIAVMPLLMTKLQDLLHDVESIFNCCLFWHAIQNQIESGKEDFRRCL